VERHGHCDDLRLFRMEFGGGPPSMAFEFSDLFVVVIAHARLFRIPLPRKERVTFGRAPHADVVIDDASVSNLHAALSTSGACALEDLGSEGGTRVHGRHLAPLAPVGVTPGTAFELGDVTVVLQRTRAADPPSGSHPKRLAPVVVDPGMQALYMMLDQFAPTSLPVLIVGETGTGKEVFAREVHARSRRGDKPFIPINCAALSASLVDSELFGHERGAFTGAVHAKAGLFEEADGGSVFLDELGELPLPTQAKLLRVLESGEFLRVGSAKHQRVDVRLLAATNADVNELLHSGRLRRDLFFRLNGFTARLPPLRERPADVLFLARHFAACAAERAGRLPPTFSSDAEMLLLAESWPGNARELRNVIERAVTLAGEDVIEAEDLGLEPASRRPLRSDVAPVPGREPPIDTLFLDSAASEKRRIEEALRKSSGNQTEAAKLLGISRRALLNKLDRFGFARPRKDARRSGRR
jgi:two-component system, NtrC family, response regulator AtoC